ncbi:MAG: hypothetical protein K0R38_3212 [Polyangiaceae bacterium]|jgi:uncharacterized RDD family membrane protein YckC|nr:hypothetical protein [Polyangiaceae bacterium]
MENELNPYQAPSADVEPFVGSVAGAPQASRAVRFANLLIDGVCRSIIGAVAAVMGAATDNAGLSLALSLGSMVGFYLFFEGMFQATPGKFITRTRVVDLDGNKPGFGQILGRTLARFVPFEPFSFFSSTKDGWHDRWSGTRVVQR